MRNIVIATVFALVFGLAAVAQTTPGSQQTMPQGTNPSTQPSTTPSTSGDMSNTGNQNTAASETKGEKKLKGCIQSEGGKYVLQDKHGKDVALAGSADLASHVGHTVTVHGTYGSGSDASSATASNSGMSASSGQQFMVSKIDMVSESCSGDKGKTKDKVTDNNSKPNPNHK